MPPSDELFDGGFLGEVRKLRPADEHVVTRFPPEPNGYLHIGHAKAIFVNFGFARHHGGKTILRFDDTNPGAEKEEYFISIEEIIRWLGFKPVKVTYSSDNFGQLYEWAEKLITLDKAYICHCTPAELSDQRGGSDDKNKKPRYACSHRSRPTEESLKEFRRMKAGEYEAGQAFLRFKTDDYKNGNPQVWDIAAYRVIKDHEHYRTKDQWCIYPTYDFAHSLCDAIENITHSLCTTEFINSRETYEWLNNTVDVPFKPIQREYGRLDIEGTVLSKRKIKKLIDSGAVTGFDDPRLYTLIALKRRGVPPGAMLSFVRELGVTTNKILIQIARLEQTVRKYLEMTVPRLMLILDPIPVFIDNLPEHYLEEIENAFGPKDIDMGSHKMPFTRKIYIDRDDFRSEDSKDFRRLTPNQPVGLMKIDYPIALTSFETDDAGEVTEIHANYQKPEEGAEPPKKPKSYIHWIADSPAHGSPVKAEARVFSPLFKSANPDKVEPSFLNDLAENSLVIYKNAMIEVGFNEIERRRPWPEEAGESNKEDSGPESVRFQAMRTAYFCKDSTSTPDKVVLNRIVGLKEDAGKVEKPVKVDNDQKRAEKAKAKTAKKSKKDEKSKDGEKANGTSAPATGAKDAEATTMAIR